MSKTWKTWGQARYEALIPLYTKVMKTTIVRIASIGIIGLALMSIIGIGLSYAFKQSTATVATPPAPPAVATTPAAPLTPDEADAIFLKQYEQFYSSFVPDKDGTYATGSDPVASMTQTFTKESWEFLVSYQDYMQLIGFSLLSTHDQILKRAEERKNYAPPSEAVRREFQSQVSIIDGKVKLPEGEIVGMNTQQAIAVDASGTVTFMPPRHLTTIVNNDTIQFNVEAFFIALLRQPDGSWKFDVLVPTHKGWITKAKLITLVTDQETRLANEPALRDLLDWLYARTEAQRETFMKPIYDLNSYQITRTPPMSIVSILLHLEPVMVSSSEFYYEENGVSGKVRYTLKKVGTDWTITVK